MMDVAACGPWTTYHATYKGGRIHVYGIVLLAVLESRSVETAQLC